MASGSAGSIYVDLLLRDANYVQGLRRAQGQTRSSTRSMGSDFQNLSGIIGGTFAGLGAGVLFTKFIQNTIDAQNEQAQLAAVLKSTGNAAGYTIEQLNSMAAAMSRESIFSAGEINNAQTRLLSYAGILGQNVKPAMQAVIDQSARLGISLEQSAETIGRALEQPSKAAAALSRQGFGSYFTKETIEMLKSLEKQGRMAEAQIKILDVLNESYAGAAKAARDTLGGALKNLNNEFQSMLTGGSGINSLAPAINLLAENLDLVGKAAIVAASAFTVSLIPAAVKTSASFVAATATFVRFEFVLGTVAFGSRAASVAMMSMLIPLRGVTAAIGVLGGPVGVAAITAFALIANGTNAAADAQKSYSAEFEKFSSEKISKYRSASEELKKQIKSDVLSRINSYQSELKVIEQIATKLDSENFLFRGMRKLGSVIGVDSSADDVRNVYKQVNQEIENLKRNLEEFETDDKSIINGIDEKEQKKLNDIYSKYEHLIRGVTKEVLNLEAAEKELNELRIAGRITNEEMYTALEAYEEQLYNTGKEMDEFAKSAARNIQTAFADFLFDPFKDGLDGMAKGFIDTVRRMIAEAQAAKLAKYLFGELAGGKEGSGDGAFGGFLKNIFGSFAGGFATGGVIPPGQWGVVGERGPELAFGGNTGQTIVPNGGGMGGNTYYMDNRGADSSAIARMEQSLLALAGPGVIEQRVMNAQRRGAL